MSINDQILSIWNSSDARSLGDALYEVLQLIQQAYEQGEVVDFPLELDIILTANYAQSYGEKFEHVLQILKLWNKAYEMSAELPVDPLFSKILRLNAITNHLILSTLSSAESEQQQLFNEGLDHLSVSSFAQLLPKLIMYTTDLLSRNVVSDWAYDNISSLLTLIAIYNTAYNGDLGLPDLAFYFNTANQDLAPLIQQWKDAIVPNSDQFRFLYMLAFENPVAEDYWVNLARQLLGGK